MKRRVQINRREMIFQKFIFKIEEATLQHELFNGQMSPELTRLNFVRGDSVAALVHDPAADTLVLTEQFRYPTVQHDLGWLHEIPAGSLPDGKDAAAHMREEMLEEIGYTCQSLRHIRTFYVSPGGTSERIILFYARVTPKDRRGAGGGLATEGEYIRRVTVKVDEALKMLEENLAGDAKTLIALQWLLLNRAKLGG